MEPKLIQEKCGLVGLYSPKYTKQLNIALQAASGVQHRGLNGTGLVSQHRNKFTRHIGYGLLREVFTSQLISKYNLDSLWTMIHCRYGTAGGYIKENLQPCVAQSRKGETVAVIHNGEFVITPQMSQQLKLGSRKGISDTPIFAEMLAKAAGRSWEEKILNVTSQMRGAFSLIIGVKDKMFAVRDPFGIRPLFIGKLNGFWLIASETHAFDKVGVDVEREVNNGEIIKIDKNGLSAIKPQSKRPYHFCDFEWAYFARPDSIFSTHENGTSSPKSWLSIMGFRERCGRVLAREKPIKNADFIVGVPDSGIAVGSGYAGQLGIPQRNLIIRDHHDPDADHRLFMRDDQIKKIKQKVLGKLSLVPDRAIWKNAVVVVADDSIVRGNVSQEITRAIFALGSKEVHWIVGFPPPAHPCHLGVSMRSGEELIAAKYQSDTSKIAKAIGATSVNYISNRGFVSARLLKSTAKKAPTPQEVFLKNGGCGGCITGLYPVSKTGQLYE